MPSFADVATRLPHDLGNNWIYTVMSRRQNELIPESGHEEGGENQPPGNQGYPLAEGGFRRSKGEGLVVGSTLVIVSVASMIEVRPGVRSGKPCFSGTRIAVYDVLEYLPQV